MKTGEVFLIIVVFLLLVLIMNPSLVGTTASSIPITETFGNVWIGLGIFGQTAILLILFIAVVVFLVNKN